ncbi:MAG: HPr family phosphocarrier protein [Alphaproteobacteria bacterium]|nr:HPr family phosphocarrier protein [Hyphomonas sp.]MBR9806110.1 HPr family phosphocarrier protein [Alphaproteobacteria bacterium]|tara:strand:- start:65 stop:370 length:306 start_codon:yes stop_codon:yes gene_type:complete
MTDTQTTASQRAMIVNRKGLHARASAKLSRLAGEFNSRIIVTHEGETADARSIMDLMMLVAHMGCEVDIRAEGPDAAEAVTAVASLIADGFGEQGDADAVC